MYLNCHSHYSLKYGLLSVRQLVHRARELGFTHLALTDINNTSCVVEFLEECDRCGIQPSVGIEFRAQNQLYYIGLAKSAEGYYQLNQLLEQHLVHRAALPRRAPELPEVYFIYDAGGSFLPASLRDNEFAGVQPNLVNRWHKYQGRVVTRQAVALHPVTLAGPDDRQTHRLLRCIDQNTIQSRLPASSCCQPHEYLKDRQTLDGIYSPYPGLLVRSQELLASCTFVQRGSTSYNKKSFNEDAGMDYRQLKQLALDGLKKRYTLISTTLISRLEVELHLIQQLHFCAYYLMAWDIVQFAISKGYRHVGRGSGANSLLAYCLLITDVDPVDLNLYFERFINPHRPVPPDFDLDFSWDERDDVLKYVQQRYGADRVGLLASYQTFKGKSVVRELGKVFGLTRSEIDLIVRQPLARDKHHPLAELIFKEGRRILELPSHLSIHSGGIVIADMPLSRLTASQMMPKGFVVLQTDMRHAAHWGLHKFDLCRPQ